MTGHKVNEFIGGWFIGDFDPVLHKTSAYEVAVKYYKKGDKEPRHFHKLADEYTVIVKGKVRMNDRVFEEGSIILIEKEESTDFEVLEDTATVVVKTRSVQGDKYIV